MNDESDRGINNQMMSKYEKTQIIGLRLSQLAAGAKPVLSPDELANCNNIRDIVLKELFLKKIPFMICRELPNKEKVYWKVQDMIVV
jgi:DNA-directed RNA polymerase subunit K/omega